MLAEKLRQSRENFDTRDELKQKKERLTPDTKSLERKEPEYSRKERLNDAREANIVIKVENVQHNHKKAVEGRLRETDSPKKVGTDKVQEKMPSSLEGLKPGVKAEVKDSPGYENVSDIEPSPAAPARLV